MSDAAQQPSADQVVRRYWDHVWIKRDLSVLGELYTDPTIRHTESGSRTVTIAQLKDNLGESLRAHRGESFSIENLDLVGDRAWLRLTLHGVSLASMTPMTIEWIGQYRLENGKIAETWALHQSGLDWSQ